MARHGPRPRWSVATEVAQAEISVDAVLDEVAQAAVARWDEDARNPPRHYGEALKAGRDRAPDASAAMAPVEARRIWTLPAFIRRGQAVGSHLSWFVGMDMDSVTDRRFSSGCGTRWR